MFGFGALSELPLSSLPAGAESVTHTGTATLSTTASVANAPSLEIHLVSSISTSVTVAAAGEANKLGTSSLSSSATQSSGAILEIGAISAISASATLAPIPKLTMKAASLASGPATVGAVGIVEITASSSMSSSGTTLNVGVIHIGVTSLLADIGILSGEMTGTIVSAGGLSSSVTITNTATLVLSQLTATMSASGTISSVGFVEKLGQADLGTLGSFTSGFTQGFDRGSFVSGHPFVSQNHLATKTTLIADATVNRFAQTVSLSASASMTASHAILANLQSIGSLAGNSVLLHGGSVNLNPIARIQPRLSTDYEQPDIIALTLYMDRLRSINGHINKTKDFTGYIDKQLSITSSIDKTSGVTGYIDKVVEKTLVRER